MWVLTNVTYKNLLKASPILKLCGINFFFLQYENKKNKNSCSFALSQTCGSYVNKQTKKSRKQAVLHFRVYIYNT